MARTTKRTKKASAKQLAALAKGRATRKRNLRAATSTKRKTVKTAVRKKAATRKTTTRKKSGGTTVKARGAVRKARAFVRKSGAVKMLTDAGLAIVGGITSGYITSKVPITDSRVRSAIPIVTGIVIAGTAGKRNPMALQVAKGMVVLGAVSLFKQLAPGVPMLAGESVIMLPPPRRMQNMGAPVMIAGKNRNSMGAPVQIGSGYKTSAM